MLLNDRSEIEKVVKKSGSSFYWGMKLLPDNKKRAMFAIYSFAEKLMTLLIICKALEILNKKLKEWKNKINNIFKSSLLDSSLKENLIILSKSLS